MKLSHQILLLVGITFLVYFTSLFNQFVWDDEQFIYKNQYVIGFNLPKIFTTNTIAGAGQMSDYYRPLTTLSFALDHAIWQLMPFGFHLTNITLHIAAGVVLLFLLRELGLKKIALAISLIFLLHPLQTEAVTYINSRGDSLYALFGLLSLLFLTKALKNQKLNFMFGPSSLQLSKVSLLTISTLFYLAAILAKEIGLMIFGLQILIILVLVIQKTKGLLINYFFLGANMTVALGYVALRATLLNFQNTFNLYHTQTEYASNLLVRMLTFSQALWVYFKLIICPYPLYMERNLSLVTSFNAAWPWLTGVLLIVITSLIIFEIKKRKTAWILLGAGWFFMSLSPVSGFVPINGLIYEHWLYLPIIGFLIFGHGLCALCSISSIKWQKNLLIALLSIYSLLTIRQNWFWRSPISLYEYLLRHTQSARIHNNLAMAYSDELDFDRAIYHYQQAIAIADIYPQTHHNLGKLYEAMNNLPAAEQEYQQAINLSPAFHFSYLPLINIYAQQQKYDQAVDLLDSLIKSYPNDQALLQYRAELVNKAK